MRVSTRDRTGISPSKRGGVEVDFAACCRMSRLYDDARIDEESMEDVPKSGRRFSAAILDVT